MTKRAQPEMRLITSTPRLQLQINLVQVYLFPPSFSPFALVAMAAVPQKGAPS